jgi:HTH-type transcriptional regulator / antitoxin MqsA
VDPDFIASVRKKPALDQREAAEIFGGGVNAFPRYENGKTKPRRLAHVCTMCTRLL